MLFDCCVYEGSILGLRNFSKYGLGFRIGENYWEILWECLGGILSLEVWI